MARDADGGAAWEEVERWFDLALEQPPESRLAWVKASVPDVRAASQVLALLAAADRQGILDAELPVGEVTPQSASDVESRLAAALAGRYEIDEVLGEGGSATVFRAHELKHQRPVVLKVLRPDVAGWIGSERFLAEIQTLARLSHPHILALIDSGEADGLLYYVMPYVRGETLGERLARGPLLPTEALPLLRDIAAALAYAHHEQVIHRDLKPDNILVVSGHAFLMDFGIAKLRPEGSATPPTLEGFAIGTPAYMAPEQAAGLTVDARADLFSWGIVAREVLIGRAPAGKPWPGRVPKALRDLVERCLAQDPAARLHDGEDLLGRLDALAAAGLASGRRGTWLAIAAAAVVLVATGYFLLKKPGAKLDGAIGPVVVLPLRNETGDSSLMVWGRMAGDWLTQGLHEAGGVAVVPWPVVLQAVESEKGKGNTDPIRSIALETDAKSVITGSYYSIGETLRFQVQVTDVRNGAVLAALPAIDVPRDSIRAGIRQLRARVMALFAIRGDQRLASLPGMLDAPPTYDAYQVFESGLERYNALDYAPAVESFIEAWHRDSSFQIARVYAAMGTLNQGQYDRADSMVRALRAGGVRFNPYHELAVQYMEAVLTGDARRALEIVREATELAPGGGAQYNLALTAMTIGRIDEALATLKAINPDHGVMRGWSPYWLLLSHVQHLRGDFAADLATSREVRKRYPDSRAGWVHEVRALAALGDTAAVDSVVSNASGLPPDTYWSQGAMLVTAGEELEAHGHPGAEHYYQRAISWLSSQLARDPMHRAHRYWMGSARLDRGDVAGAEPYFASLVRNYPAEIQFRGLWGVTAARAGDTALARRRLGDAPKFRRGTYLSFLARYAGAAGDTERALALWSEAVGTGLSGIVWIHSSARPELTAVAADPRFRQLGVIPRTGQADR